MEQKCTVGITMEIEMEAAHVYWSLPYAAVLCMCFVASNS